MHAHDASCRAVPVRIVHAGRPCGADVRNESELKNDYGWIEHNLYLACGDSPQRAFFFCTFSHSLLALLASFVDWLCSLLSLSQCHQPLAAFSTQLRKTRTLQMASSAVLRILHCQEAPFFFVLHRHLNRQCMWCMSSWAYVHVSANECKLTFLSITDTYVRTYIRMHVHMYIARIDPSFKDSWAIKHVWIISL